MSGLAQIYREKLWRTLVDAGPHAPTLCTGWSSRDLAEHIVVRDRRPDALAGAIIPLSTVQAYSVKAVQPYKQAGYEELLAMLRQGPTAGFAPTRLNPVNDAVNTLEFLIHREDVRRAADGWQPEQLTDDEARTVFSRLTMTAPLLLRKSPVGVVLDPGPQAGPPRSVRGSTALGTTTVRGPAADLALFAFGRPQVARVEVDGEPDAVNALRAAKFSI